MPPEVKPKCGGVQGPSDDQNHSCFGHRWKACHSKTSGFTSGGITLPPGASYLHVPNTLNSG